MNRILQRSFQLKAQGYLVDFLASAYPRHILTGALGVVAALLIGSTLPHRQHIAAAIQAPGGRQSPLDPEAIAQHAAGAHLFGQGDQPTSATSSAPPVNITVEGLLSSDDPASALAILDVDGKSGSFRVGDVLPDGEKLAAIAPTAVLLTQGVTQRVLELPRQDGGPGDGILLAGATGLNPRAPLFPVLASASLQTYKPALRAVSLPQNASPLDQLRALREQLIHH